MLYIVSFMVIHRRIRRRKSSLFRVSKTGRNNNLLRLGLFITILGFIFHSLNVARPLLLTGDERRITSLITNELTVLVCACNAFVHPLFNTLIRSEMLRLLKQAYIKLRSLLMSDKLRICCM